jgi:hypothetical protein
MELLGGAFVLPPPTMSAAFSQTNLVLTWPTNNGATFGLYTATNLAGPWQPINPGGQTNGAQVSVSIAPGAGPAFFRLQRSQ